LLPAAAWQKSEQAATSADVMLVVGTSALVYPAAALVPLAKFAGAKLIEINVEETPFSGRLECSLRGTAGELLPRLIA
jgi:NAD-dependent deacetylase